MVIVFVFVGVKILLIMLLIIKIIRNSEGMVCSIFLNIIDKGK